MAADSLQTTATAANRAAGARKPRGAGRPFARGQSGNPAGRRRGSQNRATLAAQFLLDGKAEALAGKAVEMALAGDAVALKLCLDRVLAPRRHRAVELALPALHSAADLAGAVAAIGAAAAQGEITPGEAFELCRVIDTALQTQAARLEEERETRLNELARSGRLPVASVGVSSRRP